MLDPLESTNSPALGQDEKQKQSCGTQPTTTMPVF